MKKNYTNPKIETIIVSSRLMDGNMATSGDPGSQFAPKRREDKPF